jgi:DTW domain-containing protein YfiP
VLLYPTDDAVELTEQAIQGLTRPITLIVPDGTWRQARKVAVREQALGSLLRVKLPPGPPSDYRLRYSPNEQRLCTFEAISRAIGLLEGAHFQGALDLLFLKKVERMMWSRGKLAPEQCTTGIPEAAFIASRLAGIAGSQKSISRSAIASPTE